MNAAACAAVLLLAATACSVVEPAEPRAPSASGPASASGAANVRYALRFRDGGSAAATVRYLLPDGQPREETVSLPWEGPVLSFGNGAVLSIVAKTAETATSPLLCVLQSVPPDTGAWVLGTVTRSRFDPPGGNQLATCATEYRLGAWPPPEDDPETGNGLIRVG